MVFSRHPHIIFLGLLAVFVTVLAFGLRRTPSEEMKVVIRCCQWGVPWQQQVAREITDAFNEKYADKGWKVVPEFYAMSRTYWTKLKTMIPAGVAPDVWLMPPTMIPDLVRMGDGGVLLELDDLLAEDKKHTDDTWRIQLDLDDYYKVAVDSFRHKGKLYSIPHQIGSMALFYNKRLFDDSNEDYPDESWDWEDFRQAAIRLTRDTNDDGVPDVWGCTIPPNPERGYGNFLWANGGRFMNEDRSRVVLADAVAPTEGPDRRSNLQKSEETLRFILDLIYSDGVAPSPESGALSGMQVTQYFAADRMAMIMGGSWMCRAFNQDPGTRDIYDVAPLPMGPTGLRGSATNALGNAINRDLEKPGNEERLKATWEFVKFYASREASEITARTKRGIPTLRAISESEVYLDEEEPPANKRIFLAPLTEGWGHDLFPSIAYQEWNDKALRPIIGQIYRETKTVRQGLREIQKIANEIIENEESPRPYRPSTLAYLPPGLILLTIIVAIVMTRRRAKAAAKKKKKVFTDRPRFRDFVHGFGFITPNFFGFLMFISLPVVASFFLAFCDWDLLSPPRLAGVKNFDNLLTQGAGESWQWIVGAGGIWLTVNFPRALLATGLLGAALFLVACWRNSRSAEAALPGPVKLTTRFWPVAVMIVALALGGRPDLFRTFFAFHRGSEDAIVEWDRLTENVGMRAAERGGVKTEKMQRRFAREFARKCRKAEPRLPREALVGGWSDRLSEAAEAAIETYAPGVGEAAVKDLKRLHRRSLKGKEEDAAAKAEFDKRAEAVRKRAEERFRKDAFAALAEQWPKKVVSWAARLREEAGLAVAVAEPSCPPEKAALFGGEYLDALLGIGPGLDGPDHRDAAASRLAPEIGIIPKNLSRDEKRDFAQSFLGRFEGRFMGPMPVRLSWADALFAAAFAAQLLLLFVPFFEWRESPRRWRRRWKLFGASFGRASKVLLVMILFIYLCDMSRVASLISVMRVPGDEEFWYYFYNTVFMMVQLPIHMAMSLSLALLVNRKLRGVYAYRVIYFLPSITAGVAVYLLWMWLYNNEAGLLNTTFTLIGDWVNSFFALFGAEFDSWRGPNWLGTIFWAKPSMMIMGLWISAGGFHMILYLAGLTGIDPQLYEAAQIDGAGKWQQFRHVTWPMLSPTTFFIFIMGVMHGLEGGFQRAYIMTQGGPDGSTTTLGYYIFNNAYQWFNMGYAAAIAWFLFLIVFIVTMINWRYGGRLVEY